MDLSGKEIKGTLGPSGSYSVDIDEKGNLRAEGAYGSEAFKAGSFLEGNVFQGLRLVTAKTGTKLDDAAIDVVESMVTGKVTPKAAIIALGDALTKATGTDLDDKVWAKAKALLA